jgi:hypothetical protein
MLKIKSFLAARATLSSQDLFILGITPGLKILF